MHFFKKYKNNYSFQIESTVSFWEMPLYHYGEENFEFNLVHYDHENEIWTHQLNVASEHVSDFEDKHKQAGTLSKEYSTFL